MDRKDYVSLEVAKMLKEKGFNEPCETELNIYSGIWTYCDYDKVGARNSNLPANKASYPTLYEAQKWLRNKYNIHIIVETDYNNMYSLKCSNSQDCEMCIELDRLTKEDSEIYIYKSYEEALDAGILEALKLI